jgi:endonuclease YncB( thermonuclease family)
VTFKRPFRAVPIELGKRYRAKRRRERLGGVAAVLGVAAVAGVVIGVAPGIYRGALASGGSQAAQLGSCRVTDGDTIRCGPERIRLLGIDAPELPGHCRHGRECAPGDPYASSDSLRDAMAGQLKITRVGTDRYGRTLALVSGTHGDLSCWQLAHGQAIYKPQWDDGRRLAAICAAAR